jgi:hypothetical protein
VALAISGSRLSIGFGVIAGESVTLGSVAVIASVSVNVGTLVVVAWGIVGDGGFILWVGCIVMPTGTHPAKAKTGINRRDNQDTDFIIRPLLIVLGLLGY